MKILQVAPHYLPAYGFGGVLHSVHSMSRALVDSGHEVKVCTTNLKDRLCDLDVETGIYNDIDGVKVIYEPVSLSRYWGFSAALYNRIKEEVDWSDIVLVHFHYQFASLAAGYISRQKKKPYVVFSHGSLNKYGIRYRGYFRKRFYLQFFEKKNFRNALFMASQSEEELVNSQTFNSTRLVPNGIEPSDYHRSPAKGYFRKKYPELDGRTVFLFLGRISRSKGLDMLIPAFAEHIRQNADAHLILAGKGEDPYEEEIFKKIKDLNISKHITMTGLLHGDDKLGALLDSDIFILPSLSEGMSMSMLEAMYMSMPVIVTDRVGLAKKIASYKCGIVVPCDQGSLIKGLKDMTMSPERKDMGNNGRLLVENGYTWDIISGNFMRLLKEYISFE